MEKKIKFDWNAFLIIGIVFSILGSIFTILGIILYILINEIIFLLNFGVIGMIFLVVGIIFLVSQLKKRSRIKKLAAEGNYIMAEVMEIYQNYNVRVNGRFPYIVCCKYEDGSGTVHTFKSRGIFYNPEGLLRDNYVRVYTNREDYSNYYVDIDSILPRVENH